jgi:hypothetical protein
MAADEVAFDPSTAKAAPVQSTGTDFDPSTARKAGTKTLRVPGGASASWTPLNEGLDTQDRVGLAMSDTMQEQKLSLERRYGKGSVVLAWGDKDTGGAPRMFLKREGKMIEVSKENSGVTASLIADSPILAGMAGGAAAGSEIPVVGTAIGAAVGAGLGYYAREAAKKAGGVQAKDAKQTAKLAAEEAAGGAAAEVGGTLIGKAAGRVMRGELPRFFTGVTDESKRLFMRAKEGGAIPHWQTSGEDLKKLARVEVDAAKLTGRYVKQFDANRKYILSEVQGVLERGGMPPNYVKVVLDEIHNPTSAFSGREVGEMIQKAIQTHAADLDLGVQGALQAFDKTIAPRIQRLSEAAARPNSHLASDVEALSTAAYADFKATASQAYGSIHAALDGAPIVPSAPIREAAQQILSKLPRSTASGVTRELGQMGSTGAEDAMLLQEFGIELPKDDMLSLEQAQRIRTILRERGKASRLTPRTVSQGDHLHLSTSVDQAIDMAAEDPKVAPFVKTFRDVNSWYKDTRAKFLDPTITQLRGLSKTKTPPDPASVVALIRESGKTSTINEVRGIVGDSVWKDVQNQDLQHIINATTVRDAAGNRTIGGLKLLNYLDSERNAEVAKAIHGEARINELRELGKALGARAGKVSPEALASGSVKDAIKGVKDAQKELDDYLNKNLLAELRMPTRPPEEVYSSIVSNESRTIEAFKLLAADPVKQQALRQAALEQLARSAEIKVITDFGRNAMGESLKAFTAKQQELLFPKGLAGDLRELDKIIQFIYPGVHEGTMASMHAGAVLETPALGKGGHITKGRWFIQATKAVARWIALNPRFMQYVLHGIPLGPRRQIVKAVIEGSTKASIVEGAQPGVEQDIPRDEP